MATNYSTQPPQPGPVAQQLTKLQSNGHQTLSNGRIQTGQLPKKKGINWGFADRTVFDWTMLVSQVLGAIAIPFVVTFVGLYATQQITLQQTQLSQSQHATDLQIARNQQDEIVLTTYLDNIKDLLLNHNLLTSKPNDKVAILARAQTLSALSALKHGDQDYEGYRRILLQFLYQTNLITKNNVIISLHDANLSFASIGDLNLKNADLSGTAMYFIVLAGTNLTGANLNNATLRGAFLASSNHGTLGANLDIASLENADLFFANLSGVNLAGADLHSANLGYTDLRGATFIRANLSNASLNGAKVTSKQLAQAASLQGTIMPDGSVHP